MHSFSASLESMPGRLFSAEHENQAAVSSPGAGVCAVIVTYRPVAAVRDNIDAIRRQVGRVVVVDNDASAASRELLATWAGDPAVELIFNAENAGIAAALNQGVERALAGNFDWVATFDQDSAIPAGFVAGLIAGWAGFPGREKVAVVAPLYRDRNLDFVYSPSGPLTKAAMHDAVVSVTATSGNLVSIRALRAAGGFREDFFIDCVDFEFCLRYRRQGWKILEVRNVVLEHEQGRWEERRLGWKRPRFNDYGAQRRYYQARNRLIMYARFGAFDLRWTLRDAWGFGCDFIKLLLLGDRRWEKVKAMAVGVWHAGSGRRGRWLVAESSR
jgi:rhamnosyltransferase